MFDRLVPEPLVQAALQRLRDDGVQPGAIVAWLGANDWALIAALVACERVGAVLLPLNTRLAVGELARLLGHAGAGHLLATPDAQPLADAVRAQATLAPGAAEGVRPGDVLLVYTSGTTGTPRGAMHTRAAMEANAAAAIAVQGLDAGTRALAVLPLFHVGGLCIQVLPTLAAGGQVRLHPRFDADAWFDDVARWRPTTTLLVPAVMHALVHHPRWEAADLSSLAFVNSGSQVVPRALIDAFHARGVPVAQVYGSTETGPVSIALRPDQALAHPGAAGWPAPGVQVRVSAGGELSVKAPQLMRGYHRSADSGLDADGWFATGDLGRQRADGAFEIVGRCDDRFVSGGENVDPAEIENLVAGWPGLAEAVAVGVPDERWGAAPVLVVVPRPGEAVDVDALRAHFEGRLARFKHPRRVLVRGTLPRTALGKVQRRALAALLADEPAAAAGP